MKTARHFSILGSAIFALAALAYCETPTPQQSSAQQTPSTARRVYEISEDSALHELIADASANSYANHAIDKDGVAMSRPDPVLLRFIKERAIATGDMAPAAETAYAAPAIQTKK